MVRDPYEMERLRLENAERQAELVADLTERQARRRAGADPAMWQSPPPEPTTAPRPRPAMQRRSAPQPFTDKQCAIIGAVIGKHVAEVRREIEAAHQCEIAALKARLDALEAAKRSRAKVIDMRPIIGRGKAA